MTSLINDPLLNKKFVLFQADDDTYVVVENLRYLLQDFETSDNIWLGNEIGVGTKERPKPGYMHGGPGYVLSRRALETFVIQVNRDSN